VATSSELPLTTDERTRELAERIQEVEQEIARVHEERARGAAASASRGRIDELEARVREAEERLEAQRKVPPRRSELPAAVMKTVYREQRLAMLVLGGLLLASGILGLGFCIRAHVEWGVASAAGAPGLIGAFVFLKALYAKNLDDLSGGDL
jgi:hypothetical protein